MAHFTNHNARIGLTSSATWGLQHKTIRGFSMNRERRPALAAAICKATSSSYKLHQSGMHPNISTGTLSCIFLLLVNGKLSLSALLVQLNHLLVQSRNLLRRKSHLVWNRRTTEAAIFQPSIVEHSLAFWTMISHSIRVT
jgi:hypothetical protein